MDKKKVTVMEVPRTRRQVRAEGRSIFNIKMWMVTLVFVLGVLLMLQGVSAIGITPGRTTLDYNPGAEHEIDLTIINSDNRDVNLVVLVQGDLNESISLSEVSISMSASEARKNLKYKVRIPDGLKPGMNTAEIVVIQLPGKSSTSEAFIGAAVGVASQLHVFVPYPGKYAEASLNVIGPDEEDKITFVLPVLNRGKLDLVRVRGSVDVYTSLNEKIETLETNQMSINAGNRGELVSVWDVSAIAPGPYRAVGTVLYDEDVVTMEKEFSVGKRLLDLLGIEVNDFTLGEIAKFEILVESKWSDTIQAAFAQIQVHNDEGEVMADFKSSSVDIEPLSKELLTAFWDTEGVRKGDYDSSLYLKYGKSSEQQELKLEVRDDKINVIGVGYVISSDSGGAGFGGGLTMILIVVIVVLVLINLVWFLILRKKFSKKNN